MAKDRQNFFYNGYVIKNIEYESFSIIEELSSEFFVMAKDKSHVFHTKNKRLAKFKGYDDTIIKLKNSDSITFSIVSPE